MHYSGCQKLFSGGISYYTKHAAASAWCSSMS